MTSQLCQQYLVIPYTNIGVNLLPVLVIWSIRIICAKCSKTFVNLLKLCVQKKLWTFFWPLWSMVNSPKVHILHHVEHCRCDKTIFNRDCVQRSVQCLNIGSFVLYSKTGCVNCSQCPAGQFSNTSAAVSCTNCSAGYLLLY